MDDDISDVSSRDLVPNQPPRKALVGTGRPKGAINKIPRRFKEFVADLLERNENNIEKWIQEVADGKPTQIIEGDPLKNRPTEIINGVDPDPAKAVDLLIKLAEYAVPKTNREVVIDNPDAGPVVPVLNISIGGKAIDLAKPNSDDE